MDTNDGADRANSEGDVSEAARQAAIRRDDLLAKWTATVAHHGDVALGLRSLATFIDDHKGIVRFNQTTTISVSLFDMNDADAREHMQMVRRIATTSVYTEDANNGRLAIFFGPVTYEIVKVWDLRMQAYYATARDAAALTDDEYARLRAGRGITNPDGTETESDDACPF